MSTNLRTYHREYARRKRDQHWQAAAQGARTCPHRHGAGRCGAVLEDATVNGRLVVRCPACERRKRGICRDCPRPVNGCVGKAVRCRTCQVRARREQGRRSVERNRDQIRLRGRRDMRRRLADPERRAALLERKRLWRQAHPEKVRAYKRREALRQLPSRLDYYRAYNARAERAAKKREHALRRYYRLHTTRPEPTCRDCGTQIEWAPPGRPPVRCVDCVPPSVAAKRRQKIAAWQPPTFADVPPRTCLTCDRVVTGRKKKCSRCKAALYINAVQRLHQAGAA